MGKPLADKARFDPGDYQHRGIGRARRRCATAVIATVVSTFFLALVNPVPVCFLHYSIVWAVIRGVDVVAHNGAALSVSLRTSCMRPFMALRRRCLRQHRKVGCVVGENIDAGVGWYDDRRIGRPET
jgi:hypothetical protein